jgi:hypothetical protein
MTLYHPDSVVSRLTRLVVQGGSASTREVEPERTPAIDTVILATRLTRSATLLASDGT